MGDDDKPGRGAFERGTRAPGRVTGACSDGGSSLLPSAPMDMDAAIVLALPGFLFLMGLEAWVNRRRRGETGYALADTLSNLSCGVGQQAVALLARAPTFAAYVWVEASWGLLDLHMGSLATWVLALVGVDLAYYWFHRCAHRVNLLWAGHVVHHHSEELNLSVALRQSWFIAFTEWPFYLPLALLGVPLEAFLAGATVNLLYQFWVHTEAVRHLGPLELVFNVPSHHRVHHGVNPRYLDANYGGVLILWDRLFGTFVPEDEPAVYGTVRPLGSGDPLWANVHRWVELAALAGRARRLRDKLWVWFAPPEWRPAELGGPTPAPAVERRRQVKHRPSASRAVLAYAAAQLSLVIGAAGLAVLTQVAGSPLERLALGAWLIASVTALGGLVEERPWARGLEALRVAAATAIVLGLAGLTPWAGALALGWCGLSAVCLLRLAPGARGKAALEPTPLPAASGP